MISMMQLFIPVEIYSFDFYKWLLTMWYMIMGVTVGILLKREPIEPPTKNSKTISLGTIGQFILAFALSFIFQGIGINPVMAGLYATGFGTAGNLFSKIMKSRITKAEAQDQLKIAMEMLTEAMEILSQSKTSSDMDERKSALLDAALRLRLERVKEKDEEKEVKRYPFNNSDGKFEKAMAKDYVEYQAKFEKDIIPMLHFNVNGIIIAANKAMEVILGKSKDLILGCNVLKLKNKELVKAFKQVLKGKRQIYDGEFRPSDSDGRTLRIRAIIIPILHDKSSIGAELRIEKLHSIEYNDISRPRPRAKKMTIHEAVSILKKVGELPEDYSVK